MPLNVLIKDVEWMAEMIYLKADCFKLRSNLRKWSNVCETWAWRGFFDSMNISSGHFFTSSLKVDLEQVRQEASSFPPKILEDWGI